MSTSPTPNTSPSLDDAIKQWEAAQQQQAQDQKTLSGLYQHLLDMIDKLKADPSAILQYFFFQIMPETTTVTGDSMNMLAASMNVGSAMQKDLTAAQNDMNKIAGKKNTPSGSKAAQDLINKLQELWDACDKNTGYLSPDVANGVKAAIGQISSLFGGNPNNPPSSLNPLTVEQTIYQWAQDSGPGHPGGAVGAPDLMSQLQGAFTQINNNVAAFSQGTNGQLQYESNDYTKDLNFWQGALKSLQQGSQSSIQNQIPRG